MGKKLGTPGKFGQVAGKGGKKTPPAVVKLQKLDAKTVGSAMGILKKHHN